MSWFSAFSPLNDDPLKGELAPVQVHDFSANQLTFAQGAYNRAWAVPAPLILDTIVSGFMPMENAFQAGAAFGKKPFGPWYGDDPNWALGVAFPDITGGMIKVRG